MRKGGPPDIQNVKAELPTKDFKTKERLLSWKKVAILLFERNQ